MNFTKYENQYTAEQSVGGDPFVLHVEAEPTSTINVEVKTAGEKFALVDSATGSVLDECYTNGGIPATIRVTVSGCENTPTAEITE